MRINQGKNHAVLRGVVADTPALSHRVHNLSFYRIPLSVSRLSGKEDILNILASETLLDTCPLTLGSQIEVTGEIRSFNNRSNIGSRLVITLFAKSILHTSEAPCNEVMLNGVICKKPILRRTPLGRDICDLLLAVNRKYRRADYLPCIAWGTLALFCSHLEIGDCIAIDGRLQSRVYTKTIGETSIEHTAFELSIMSLDTIANQSPLP